MPGPMLRFCYEMLERGDRMDDLDYTFGPLVVHGDPKLLDNILPRYKPFVYEERLQILFGQLPDHVVSPTEIMLVMHNVALWGGGPLYHTHSEIYLWASAWAVEKAGWLTPSVKDTLKDMPTWQDIQGRYGHDYHAIAAEIRRKVISHARSSRKQARKQQNPQE